MKKWLHKIFKNQLLLFIVLLLLIGIISGIIYYIKLDKTAVLSIKGNLSVLGSTIETNRINNYLNDLLLIFIIFVSSYIVLIIPISLFIIVYKGFMVGFSLAGLFGCFGIKGLLFGFIFNFINNALIIILLLYLTYICIKFGIKLINIIFLKKEENITPIIKIHIYRSIIVLITYGILDTIIYFFGNKFLNLFIFLI